MSLLNHIPILQILFSFFGALCAIFTLRYRTIARIISIVSVCCALVISTYYLTIIKEAQVSYVFGDWLPKVGIEYKLTFLNQSIIVFLNFVLLFVLLFCNNLIQETILKFIDKRRGALFYAVLLFAHTGYLGIVSTNDFFNFYVFIEISSLSAYVLMSQGGDLRSNVGAFDYLIMGSIGATLILIAIGLILSVTGSLNMHDTAIRLPEHYNSRVIIAGVSFFIIGAIIKIAFFPMHFWMIRAYNSAPCIVLVYLASISTVVGMYIIYKFSYLIINYDIFNIAVSNFIRPIALFTIIIAPYFAYKAKKLRSIIIYSGVTQVGYAFLLYAMHDGFKILPNFLLLDGINKIIMFLITAYYEVYGKKIYKRILWRIAVVIAIFYSCALPISPLFFVKLSILNLCLQQDLLLDFLIILVSSVLSLFYHYRIIEILFWSIKDQVSLIK